MSWTEEGEHEDIPIDDEESVEEVLIGSTSSTVRAAADRGVAALRCFESFWVRHQAGELHQDAVASTDKAASLFSILGPDSSFATA